MRVAWYLVGVPVVATLHCFLWLRLFGQGFRAGETKPVPREWSRWYSWRRMALAALSVPGVLPGFFVLALPLRGLLRDDRRELIALAVMNGLIWGFAVVAVSRAVLL